MHRMSDAMMFRVAMSVEDWALIDTALTAYAHNAAYRELREKLKMQVPNARALSDVSQSANVSSARQHNAKNAASGR